jgi:hypothetical protein
MAKNKKIKHSNNLLGGAKHGSTQIPKSQTYNFGFQLNQPQKFLKHII